MKLISTRTTHDTATLTKKEATFQATKGEAAALEVALKVLNHWKRVALEALDINENAADFTTCDLCLEGSEVVVKVKQGSNG